MASSRPKESKIPLSIDSKLKKVSKIPLRVNQKTTLTKPKVIPKAEGRLNTAIDRNKKSTTEAKSVKKSTTSSQILKDRNRVSSRENALHAVTKKTSKSDDPFKTCHKEKQVSSNCPSQVLKDRNKVTSKKNALLPVTMKVPEIHVLDDNPFKTCDTEKVKNSNHPSQGNIEFVADENMKKFILSNRELTPSILKRCSNLKISSVNERSSFFKKMNIPKDPFKQALKDIANSDLAEEGRRVSMMQKNRLHLSPFQNRNSMYKPAKFIGDPYQEALKSIAKLKISQKTKSCKKKVTFNLAGDDKSSDSKNKDDCQGKKSVSTIQFKLNKLSEKNSGCSSLTPEFKGFLLTPGNNPSKTEKVFENKMINIESDLILDEKRSDFFINTSPVASSLNTAANNGEVVQNLSPILCQKLKSDKSAVFFNQEIKNSILKKTVNPFLDSLRTSEVRQSLFSKQSNNILDKMNPKIFTPQPVSFYPQTEQQKSISPEFLSIRTTDILSCAPINTPLVLKSLGRREMSPVCKKLQFNDSPPKESKKEAGDSRENSQTFYLQNIITQQKILDQLAHQECSIFMHEATFPCEIRQNLRNPIARILNDGDDMHFVPLSQWR